MQKAGRHDGSGGGFFDQEERRNKKGNKETRKYGF